MKFLFKSPRFLSSIALILAGCETPTTPPYPNLDIDFECPVIGQETQCLKSEAAPLKKAQHPQFRTLNWERQELKRQLELESQQRKQMRVLEAERQKKFFDEQRQAIKKDQLAFKQQQEQLMTAQDLRKAKEVGAAKSNLHQELLSNVKRID